MYIDSHVNLHAPQYDEDRQDVIERARHAGVGLMVNICDRLSNFEAVYDIAAQNSDIWATVGTHPHEARENPELKATDIIDLAQRPKIVGIGECGLDYHYDFSPRPIQRAVFREHCIAARATRLPLVVHTRLADEDCWDILSDEYTKGEFKILLHCYTSGPELAQKAESLKAWYSVSGIATFKPAQDVRDIIKDMPDDKIIIETDCPYLAPIPMRGRRNEPAFIPHIYQKLAEIKNWPLEEVRTKTHKAFYELFDRIPKP